MHSLIPGAAVLEAGAVSVLCWFECKLRGAWIAAVAPDRGQTHGHVLCPSPYRIQSTQQFQALQAQYSGFSPHHHPHYPDVPAAEQSTPHMSAHPEPMMRQQEPANPTKRTDHIQSTSGSRLCNMCRREMHWFWYQDTSTYPTVR